MKTYTYSYQNGLCRGREVRPGTRPDGANARNGVGAYCIRPPNGPVGPNGWTPERPVGPPDHSPGRNPGRRNPGRASADAGEFGRVPECTYHGRGVLHTPPQRAPGPEWMYRPARIRPHRVPGPPRVSP